MDPICHSLTGAALSAAGLRRCTALATTTLVLAANAPDIDVLLCVPDAFPLGCHRGWTHGVLGLAVLPFLLTGLMLLVARYVRRPPADGPPLRAQGLLLISVIGVATHLLLDFTNSYGIRLLLPFSDRWFYGDALYIVDPWLYLTLGGGLLLARWRAGGGRGRVWAARIGLAAAACYVAAMLASNVWARQAVAAGLARAGLAETRFMVTPVPVNPLRREVIFDAGDRYERGFVWFEPSPHFRPAGFGVDKGLNAPAVNAAMLTPRAQRYLAWSRFPFFITDTTPQGTRVYMNDYRYATGSGREGWAGTEVSPPPNPPNP